MAEAATRWPYEELLRRIVYRPLGLRDTSLPLGYEMPEPYMHGYAVEPPAPPEDVSEALSASGVWASGGIVSTPRDMTRFIRGYAAGRLTSQAVLREQRRWIEGASEPAGPGRNRAGLGIFRYDTRCGTVLGHTGNFPGYTQLIAATPDGRNSLTFSLTTQVNRAVDPALLERLRAGRGERGVHSARRTPPVSGRRARRRAAQGAPRGRHGGPASTVPAAACSGPGPPRRRAGARECAASRIPRVGRHSNGTSSRTLTHRSRPPRTPDAPTGRPVSGGADAASPECG